ncbi:MAG: hypothetical protein JSS86_00510 [Cyanobacteria bacterium SZAS LIN-2]|nr:hypothetical protein [Cyanobacteria bacterium SZAS LIN-3]MBS1994750.1 hypothetical protein [Cyanobacteria bacterium SZAS LIN-2]MBS2009960.1 hypothetical protein [Cyanobacteria bacterium SZAS TMP-1]
MSAEPHQDPSQKWLIFFFCCFASSVLAIGVWAMFCYDVNKVEAPVAAGGHH